ncbi:hypothetical protein BKA70DRAFT_1176245 [Coprinopsis sp. MPI-PUGE-AT-0042]|nr:hypothetical protein BKA70DRAFT_1176245 [Coprinopsis sp. MPI-PUGE-AT-0042]
MPQNEDDLIQSRVLQLKAITTRRNDLLREMFLLMRHRDVVGGLLEVEDLREGEEDPEWGNFSSTLDLEKHGEQGFIANNVETLLESMGPHESASPQSRAESAPVKDEEPTSARARNTSRKPSQDPRDANVEPDDSEDELDLLASDSMDQPPSSSPSRELGVEPTQVTSPPPNGAKSDTRDSKQSGDEEGGMEDVDIRQESEPGREPPAPPPMQMTSQDAPTTVSPQAIFVPSTSSPSFQHAPRSSIVIPTPAEPALSMDRYNVDLPQQPEIPQATTSPTLHHSLKSDYPLPPLQSLPPEFNRKKSTKRKKDRDRGDKSQKDDALPMGINRWTAMLTANPVYKRMSKSAKCLSSKDWSIAMAELRLIRTAERIETLKSQARWGLRQVKKQRAVGGLMKTHWDYLLDEMKWMRIDFREERKWKLALAYHLSTAVLEWHSLNSWEERVTQGICVKWKPVSSAPKDSEPPEQMDVDPASEDDMEADIPASKSLLGVDYGSDTEDGENDEKKPTDVTDQLAPTAVINDAMDTADDMRQQEAGQVPNPQSPALQLKTEEVDGTLALNNAPTGDSVPTDIAQKALKSASNDPLLGSKSSSHSLNGDAEDKPAIKAKASAYAPLREKLVYSSDKLFVGLEDLESAVEEGAGKDGPATLDFISLFPDLQPLSMLDVAPPATEAKKKSSRSERDDPNKRVEETNYTKVYPAGQFMYSRPTLLGPLHPAKRWKDGSWLNMEEVPVTPDAESSSYIKAVDESVSDLFDLKVKSGPVAQLPRDSRRTKVDQYWSSSDDMLLKSLVDKYPGNWNLISECFNGCRKTTPSDRRTAVDCQDRWKSKWGSELQGKDAAQANSEDQTPNSMQVSSSDMAASSSNNVGAGPSVTTRNKRLASVSSQTAPTIAAGSEPKKRRRHLLLQETIRKTNRKRTEQQQKLLANQRKVPGMHETHAPLMKLPKRNPGELSRIKAEKDAQVLADMQRARQRVEENKGLPRLNGIPIPSGALPQAGQQTPVQAAQGGQPQPMSQQVVQQLQLLQAAQAQANQANRAGNAAPTNARVGNIARMSTPGVAGAPRFTSQQMMQLQQRMATGQQPGTGSAAQAPNGQPTAQYIPRDATASPATHGMNSPHVTPGVGVAAQLPHNPANPSNAVNQTAPAPVAGAAASTRPATQFPLFSANGTNLAVANYNAEQLNAMRIHLLTQLGQHPQATAAATAQAPSQVPPS